MITPERADRYRQQALAAIASRAHNKAAPGVSCVVVTPHDILDLTDAYNELSAQQQKAAEEAPPS